MTYKQIKKLILGNIFSESIAGEEIETDYNCQADYVKRIPALINEAELYVATTAKKIRELVSLEDLDKETKNGFDFYELPSDYYRMTNSGLFYMDADSADLVGKRFTNYRRYGEKTIAMPENAGENLWLEYYRYPHMLSDSPDDSLEIDNAPEVHGAIALYVSAKLVQYDNSYMYASLYNMFETQLQRFSEPTIVERSYIKDAYSF